MNINNYKVLVLSDEKTFIKKANYYHINIKLIKKSRYLISKSDYQKIKKYVPDIKIIILKDYSQKGLITYLKNNYFIILIFIIFIFSYFIFTNLIIKVNINTSDNILKNQIKVSLKNYSIKPFSLKHNFNELAKIKSSLLEEYKIDIEWLEIKRVGMTYQVYLVKRINNLEVNKSDYCNIYAKKEGLITRVIYDRGELLVDQNSLVKKGDLLITGKIMFNDDVKNYACASGKVYAEVWYTINLSIPRTFIKKEVMKKHHYNLYYDDYNLLNHQYKTYESNIIKKINKFKLVKESKARVIKVVLSEDELIKKAQLLIKDKLDIKLNKDYTIINQKVLKKNLNDSTMDMVVFISVEENIANQVIEMKEWGCF